jgi:hypothetical protein
VGLSLYERGGLRDAESPGVSRPGRHDRGFDPTTYVTTGTVCQTVDCTHGQFWKTPPRHRSTSLLLGWSVGRAILQVPMRVRRRMSNNRTLMSPVEEP